MSLFEAITAAYPELTKNQNKAFWDGTIILQDDSDGKGVFLAVWNYSKPIPDGIKLGK